MEKNKDKTKKTFNDFLETYSTAPQLHRKTWEQSGVDWEKFRARPSYYREKAKGFIYYSDTVSFAENNFRLIAEMLLNDFYFNSGYFDRIKEYRDSKQKLYNYLSMITWGLLVYELTEYLNN